MMLMTCNFAFAYRLAFLLFYGSCQVRSVQAEHPLAPFCPEALKRTILLLQHQTLQCNLADDILLSSPCVGGFIKFDLSSSVWCLLKTLLKMITCDNNNNTSCMLPPKSVIGHFLVHPSLLV